MIPVFQSRVGVDAGNCFEAAIATMLGVELADVPASGVEGNGDAGWLAYQDRLDDWLRWDHGLTLWGIRLIDGVKLAGMDFAPRTLWLASIATPVGTTGHAFVCRGNQVVHDPYPVELRADPSPPYLAEPVVEAIYLLLPRR